MRKTMILWKVFRLGFVLLLLWCGLTEGVQLFSRMFFHTWVAGDWFLVFLASDAKELLTFASLEWTSLGVCCLIPLAALAIGIVSLRVPRRWWLALVGCWCVYAGLGWWLYGRTWTPAFLAYDTARGLKDYLALVDEGRWTEKDEALSRAARSDPRTKELPTLVLVLGESLTSSRLGIYGYPLDTTPNLAVLVTNGLEVLPPRQVTASYTAKALQDLLVRNGVSFVRKMRQKGYHPVLLSAQRHWERYCGVEQMVFSACECKRYLCEEGRSVRDFGLVDLVKEELKTAERPQLLVVHMNGSHFPYRQQYPNYWTKIEGMDDYDMTVRVTDIVLSDIIRALPKNAVFLFTSDHGETPDSTTFRDADDSDLWRVPLLIYPKGAANFLEIVANDPRDAESFR